MFRATLIFGVAVIAAGFIAAPSFAQDYQADPTYGSAQLTSGFTPDPYQIQLTAGGSVDVAQSIGGTCTGFVANAPDFDLYFDAGGLLPLAISVASDADTTLLINGPDGRWYCDDDSGGGLNPSLVFENPQNGRYDIWVGVYGNTMAPAILAISELSSY